MAMCSSLDIDLLSLRWLTCIPCALSKPCIHMIDQQPTLDQLQVCPADSHSDHSGSEYFPLSNIDGRFSLKILAQSGGGVVNVGLCLDVFLQKLLEKHSVLHVIKAPSLILRYRVHYLTFHELYDLEMCMHKMQIHIHVLQ